ncbi:hypothetical protein SASPL_151646 [Salvia splendens]|uniref:ATP-binding cassette, subfamily B (MDR/TAP), member 1 n=1 Tax=Salvia splendens TaxID=180675 RepID=A0A8X8Z3S9_SALSN|nr:hypothetical protein SASPL_151646 [Salvia splendens]
MAATPLAPSFNLYSPKHLIKHKTSRLKLKLSSNLYRQPLSCLPTSVPQPISVKGSRALAASRIIRRAYVSGPDFDAIVSEVDPKIDGAEVVELQPLDVISGGLLWKLVSRHKWRVLASVLTLFGCTTCTLAMPLFSGRESELTTFILHCKLLFFRQNSCTFVEIPLFSGSKSKLIAFTLLCKLLFFLLNSCVACHLRLCLMMVFSRKFFEVLIGARPDPIWQLLSKVGLLYTLELIFTIIFVVNMNGIWEKVMSSLRAQIFQRVLIQKVNLFSCTMLTLWSFFDKYKVGELTSLLTSDLGSLKTIVSDNVSRDRGFRAISEASYSTLCKKKAFFSLYLSMKFSFWRLVIGTLCVLFTLSPQLAPVLGLLMLTVSAVFAAYKRTTVSVFKSHGSVQATIADCVTETFAAIRTILNYERSGMTLGVFKSINESITRVAVYVSLMALYCLGGSKVKAGELAVGTMVSFIGYTFTLTFAVRAFAAVERINSVLSGAEIDEALAYALEKDLNRRKSHDPNLEPLLADSNGKMQTSRVRYMSSLKSGSDVRKLAESGDIHLEDVHFSYPLRSDVEILQGLDLTLKCGTVTALVGSSGAGKSTVVQLLARYYEPTRGRITVAGEDLRSFDRSEWARAVSIVNQEPVLFSVSVGENIAYGLLDDNVSKDDSRVYNLIATVEDRGRYVAVIPSFYFQRIAIARALLKNAPILILDELLVLFLYHSTLDDVHLIKFGGYRPRVLWILLANVWFRTTLVIAHRLSTVQNADQIALCSDGKVSELGTHLELIEQKGPICVPRWLPKACIRVTDSQII